MTKTRITFMNMGSVGRILRGISNDLHDVGIEIVPSVREAEWIFVNPAPQEPVLDHLRRGIVGESKDSKFLLQERKDPASLTSNPQLREILELPNVKIFAKISCLNDRGLNNETYAADAYHWGRVAQAAGELDALMPQVRPIGPNVMKKLHAFFPLVAYDDWSWARNYVDDSHIAVKRTIDVAFGGTVDLIDMTRKMGIARRPHHDAYSYHRLRGLMSVMRIGGHRTVLGLRNNCDIDLYAQILKSSKIYVSPYGLGEQSLKDFHALLFGCVLIKPQSTYMHTYYPNIYTNEFHVSCAVDFSDLHAVVENVLDNYEALREKSLKARRLIIDAFDHRPIARDLKALMKQSE